MALSLMVSGKSPEAIALVFASLQTEHPKHNRVDTILPAPDPPILVATYPASRQNRVMLPDIRICDPGLSRLCGIGYTLGP